MDFFVMLIIALLITSPIYILRDIDIKLKVKKDKGLFVFKSSTIYIYYSLMFFLLTILSSILIFLKVVPNLNLFLMILSFICLLCGFLLAIICLRKKLIIENDKLVYNNILNRRTIIYLNEIKDIQIQGKLLIDLVIYSNNGNNIAITDFFRGYRDLIEKLEEIIDGQFKNKFTELRCISKHFK